VARTQKIYALKLGRQGRVVIPAAVREAMGLEAGDTLVCRAEGDWIILKAGRDAEEELWKSFAKVKSSLSQELIAERQREARRERED
jgi:AbrB family looped-hinge helix DNA binding protein